MLAFIGCQATLVTFGRATGKEQEETLATSEFKQRVKTGFLFLFVLPTCNLCCAYCFAVLTAGSVAWLTISVPRKKRVVAQIVRSKDAISKARNTNKNATLAL